MGNETLADRLLRLIPLEREEQAMERNGKTAGKDTGKTSGKAHDDPRAMKLAETTDVSPNQAKELLRKHGEAEAKRRARDFKAES